MYISHQGLRLIHEDHVNESLRRAEQQRLIKASRPQVDAATKAIPVRVVLHLAARLLRGVDTTPAGS